MDKSIDAYDIKERVALYDKDMTIMHPNRFRMAEVPLEFMPFSGDTALHGLDLGVGTGFFTKMFLEKFSKANVVAIDGATAMVEASRVRLQELVSAVNFITADFRDLEKVLTQDMKFDVVFSSFALHHLTIEEKTQMLKIVLRHLKPGGLFFNADNIIAETPFVEERFQWLRVNGIVSRVNGRDERYKDFVTTRTLLDKLEAEENDQPIKLSEELNILSQVGFKNIDVLWKDYREVVLFGKR